MLTILYNRLYKQGLSRAMDPRANGALLSKLTNETWRLYLRRTKNWSKEKEGGVVEKLGEREKREDWEREQREDRDREKTDKMELRWQFKEEEEHQHLPLLVV